MGVLTVWSLPHGSCATCIPALSCMREMCHWSRQGCLFILLQYIRMCKDCGRPRTSSISRSHSSLSKISTGIGTNISRTFSTFLIRIIDIVAAGGDERQGRRSTAGRKQVAAVLVALLLGGYMWRTIDRNWDWEDEERLFRSALQVYSSTPCQLPIYCPCLAASRASSSLRQTTACTNVSSNTAALEAASWT